MPVGEDPDTAALLKLNIYKISSSQQYWKNVLNFNRSCLFMLDVM